MIKPLFAAAATLFTAQVFAGPVNINTADAATLADELNGVGPVVAERIVEHRSNQGPFTSAEQLTQVRGIGSRTLEKNAAFIQLQ
ncbi:MAG: helix-hairpin-helix domain-containing protein [Oceanococcaceae bacterium]